MYRVLHIYEPGDGTLYQSKDSDDENVIRQHLQELLTQYYACSEKVEVDCSGKFISFKAYAQGMERHFWVTVLEEDDDG